MCGLRSPDTQEKYRMNVNPRLYAPYLTSVLSSTGYKRDFDDSEPDLVEGHKLRKLFFA